MKTIFNRKSNYIKYALAFCIIIGIELLVFNYKYFMTAQNTAMEHPYETGSGLESNEDGTYTVCKEEDQTISVSHINQHIQSIQTDVIRREDGNDQPMPLKITFEMDDAAHSSLFEFGSRTVVEGGVSEHLYIRSSIRYFS